MDWFYDAFMTFLDLQMFGCMDFQCRDRNLSSFITNVLICVSKMDENVKDVWNDMRVRMMGGQLLCGRYRDYHGLP